jgi:hypothetical protein
MRHIGFTLALAALVPAAGCTSTKWNMFRGKEEQKVATTAPTAAALVEYLNDNADRVNTVRCASLDLQCSQGLRSVGLSGKMVCQKPRNFRMSGNAFGQQEIDLGSNDQEFWFWVKRGAPYQFHCSHQALAEGRVQQLPFPVQPDWIIEALGVAHYGAAEKYQVVTKRDTWELVERTRSPQGKAIRKVTVFRQGRAPAGSPQVLAHLLVDDATGNEICSAQVVQVVVDRGTGAVLPRRVVLRWPAEKIKLTMTLDDVTVNGQLNRPDLLFTRTPLNGVKSVDLAEGRIDGSGNSVQPVEGRSR